MNKHDQVLKLEKHFEIEIYSSSDPNELDSNNQNIYEVNEDNEIVYLRIISTAVSDISILSKFPHLKVLILSGNGISDISPLKNLIQLRNLNLGSNSISEISSLEKLVNLNELSLWNNKIDDISVLKNLVKLESLDLWRNLVSDASSLKNLTQLNLLDLGENKITDISFLKKLTKLSSLLLGSNTINEISILENLVLLKTLTLESNNISNIVVFEKILDLNFLRIGKNPIKDYTIISKLNKLSYLSLDDSLISNIDFLQNLTQLTRLHLSNNIISDISILTNFTNLTHLNLSKNKINNILSLKDITKLIYLDLRSNEITDIRILLKLIQEGIVINGDEFNIGLNLINNPLEYPPLHTLEEGNDAIVRFFKKIEKEGTDTIFEAKLTLVGEGSAGKTSLLKRLLNSREKLPEEKNRTRGISIVDWEFKKQSNKKHIAHIWDFGGQDVYYPVHRFFLTENSVFVLLASSRQNTHHFDYWIPTIYQFGGKSPIILGQTCHDGNTTPWNDVGAYIANENFNIIKDQEQNYHEINLPDKNKGLLQIKKSIINQILNLPHYKKSVPKSWIPVRELINNLQEKNCITYFDLKETIKFSNSQSFANKEDIDDCLRFFHSIGIILWYHKEAKLKNWIILNPKWSVDAVYKIIDDDKILNQKGIIFSSDFERVWNETIYEDKHEILKDMLEVFKIAFPKKHNKSDYIMPTRLQSIPSDSIWADSESCLRIEYQYDFMPKGLVNQISAELSRYIIDDNQVWNNGVNFCDDETTCQVFEDFYHRKITVKAKGKDARGIIMIIMNALKDITDGYKGVTPKIIIPCVCAKCLTKKDSTTFSYEMLLDKIKEKADSKVFCNISEEVFKVEELLYNIGLPNPIKVIREEVEKMEKIMDEKNSRPKIFVTYSWSDENSDFDEEHQNKVGKFVNQLRTEWNLDASFDLYKEENNFMKMMYENLSNNNKIIIVLSKGYAVKANSFKGGVGAEYERIINDIKERPQKYILVSFDKRNNSIYPFGFQGNDVIEIDSDLVVENLTDSQNRLLAKLTDEPLIEIPALGGKTPKVTKKVF
ncbi:COR domain-containing protein [Flavobacterium sp. ABG]|uniref:COR domain-containing protein n=1 Tax=Flavobacterium sp. ABG TaxID=1423322 RepID=UPI00064A2C4E|nr:COR domain-containing protein [Flavobacterium sp. ABG]KLT69976.1 hypothetical protein AB674_09755 [Flavobacterium sp. ABG]